MKLPVRSPDNQLASISGGFSLTSGEAVLCAVLPVLLLISVFSMCIKGCRKKRNSPRASDESELNQGEAGASGSIRTIEIDLNNEANGRPLSHDRALPEIPAIPSGVTSTDDDDDDDEGHYDIISKGKKIPFKDQPSASVVAAPCSSSSSTKKSKSHPYEKVRGDPDSDSVYAGIKDEVGTGVNYSLSKLTQKKASGKTSTGTVSGDMQLLETLTSADSVHSNLYATVGTGQQNHGNNGLAVFTNSSFPCSTQCFAFPTQSLDIAGSGTTASPGASVPSVPQKMFDFSEEGGATSGRRASSQLDSSPSLPPRNNDLAVGGTSNGNQLSSSTGRASGSGMGLSALIPSIGPWTTMAAYPSLIIDVSDAGSAAMSAETSEPPSTTTSAKRVPDYTSVTARESLESLRKRQQQEAIQMQVTQFPDIDGTYDTINYDQVKIPSVTGHALANASVAENVYNNGSELYAEIATETNSARSSTYAKVGDLSHAGSSNISVCPPPAPPSVNTLQQLTHANLDDHADPGYSRVDIQRPRSVHIVSSSTVASSSHQTGGGRSPVYAVVNKNRHSNRQTIHVDENVDRDLWRNDENDSLANLYAKVSKPKNHRRTSSSGASFVLNDTPLGTLVFGGARPKIRNQGSSHIEVGRSDHSYATIDNVVNGAGKTEDPDYDVVGDGNSLDGLPEYDPNYETVPVSHIPSTSTALRSSVHSGVALEIVPNGILSQPRQQVSLVHAKPSVWHLPRREHIYEVVSDTIDRPVHSIFNNPSMQHGTDL